MAVDAKTLEYISARVFSMLAKTFPVVCASDEFCFFPHIADPDQTSDPWDDFSPGKIAEITREISESLLYIDQLSVPDYDKAGMADRNMLALFLNNLRDQLDRLALWKKQPSFYLTLMNAGLAQAVNCGDKKLLSRRLKSIPDFLDQASQNLEEVPGYWKEISLSMTDDCKCFIDLLATDKRVIESSFKAIEKLEHKIESVPGGTDLNISTELLDKIYSNHLATGLKIPEISGIIKAEIYEMCQVMLAEARQILNKPVRSTLEPEILIKTVYDRIGS
jgi:hypothetical protein